MALGDALDTTWAVELRPLRAQRSDRIALLADFAAQLGDALGLEGRLELDLVDIGSCHHEGGNNDEIEQSHELHRCLMTSASDGRCGSGTGSSGLADASVRSPARSLAERARGFAAIS